MAAYPCIKRGFSRSEHPSRFRDGTCSHPRTSPQKNHYRAGLYAGLGSTSAGLPPGMVKRPSKGSVRPKSVKDKPHGIRQCAECKTTDTPQWRRGPQGAWERLYLLEPFACLFAFSFDWPPTAACVTRRAHTLPPRVLQWPMSCHVLRGPSPPCLHANTLATLPMNPQAWGLCATRVDSSSSTCTTATRRTRGGGSCT